MPRRDDIDFPVSWDWHVYYSRIGTSKTPVKHLVPKFCQSCYHYRSDGLCQCREPSDMLDIRCPDWHPQEPV
jgi:hypothetical protein